REHEATAGAHLEAALLEGADPPLDAGQVDEDRERPADGGARGAHRPDDLGGAPRALVGAVDAEDVRPGSRERDEGGERPRGGAHRRDDLPPRLAHGARVYVPPVAGEARPGAA